MTDQWLYMANEMANEGRAATADEQVWDVSPGFAMEVSPIDSVLTDEDDL